jgi:cytochrome c-type biogenesis protein CcmH/NrfG
LSRADRGRVIGTVFAVLVICSLVAGGVLPVVVDRMGQEAPAPVATTIAGAPSQYEGELRSAIERQPDNPQPMVSLANLLVAQGNGDEAIEWYERAIELDPNRLQTRLDFGYALARRGSLSDAEVQYQRAIAIDGQSPDAHFLLGELYLIWQPPRLGEARTAFEQAIAVQPQSVAASQAAEALAGLERSVGSPVATP